MTQIITVLPVIISKFEENPNDPFYDPEGQNFMAIIIPLILALVFYLISFLIHTSLLTERNSIVTTGKLVVFEELGSGSSSPLFYADNKPGRVPLFNFELDGEEVSIGAAYYDRSLTKDDIGKQYRIRYHRRIGVNLCVDDEIALKHHNSIVNRRFWITIFFASIFLLLGILTWIYGADVVWWDTIFKPLVPYFT